jgi:hypothetical protein
MTRNYIGMSSFKIFLKKKPLHLNVSLLFVLASFLLLLIAVMLGFLIENLIEKKFSPQKSVGVSQYVPRAQTPFLSPRTQAFSLKESAGLRRNFFFGHSEFSDILRGMEVISATADVFHERKKNKVYLKDLKMGQIFEESLSYIPYLTFMQLGMNEIYTFPSTFLLFEDEDYQRAFDVASLSVLDKRIIGNPITLAAYTAHVFLREPLLAAQYYKLLSQKPNMPEWILQLSQKLETGKDPFLTDPKVRYTLCSVIIRSFPKISTEFLKKRSECKGVVKPK